MQISQVAKVAGVGVETIRFYERRGLIVQPTRPRDGGYRSYDDGLVERIKFIKQAQELGFSLREIAELLSLRADPDADCSNVRAQAVVKREDVNNKIARLKQIRNALDELISSCPGNGTLGACTIMDTFAGRRTTKAVLLDEQTDNKKRQTKKGHKVKTASFKIDGMHCDGCARTIQALVSSEPGVHKATVSFKTRDARILFDPQAKSEEQLAATIQKAGFSVVTQET